MGGVSVVRYHVGLIGTQLLPMFWGGAQPVLATPPGLLLFRSRLVVPPDFPPQYDVHMPLLTVHETLLFARRCMWASGCKNMLEAEAEKVGFG